MPARVSRHVLKPTYTFALGLISAILFVVLSVTGLALMLYYVPYPPEAYRSMKDLQFVVTFGIVLRNMHRWSAHAMVAVVFLHMCRVFWTGSYKPPREFNWVVGVLLLLLDAGSVVHRLPAAVGSAGVLGDHGRHQHRRLRAGGRRPGEVPAARRPRDRADDAAALLRPALRDAAARDADAHLAARLARAKGRAERRRGPRVARRGSGWRLPGVHEDLRAHGAHQAAAGVGRGARSQRRSVRLAAPAVPRAAGRARR